ncbi:MAG: EF-hand domain-containing protein [Pseudoxanthomonas sp.]
MGKTTWVLALAALLTTGAMSAQEKAKSHATATAGEANAAVVSFLEQFDSDADGNVGWTQFVEFRKQRYADTDENRDGSVTVQEYTNEYLGRLDRRMEAERKGQVEQTHTRIKALDTDKDGMISRAEFKASGERAYAQYEKNTGVAEAKPSGRRSAINMPSTHNSKGMLEIYDADGDGKVSRAEYDRGRDDAFARTDVDGDGKLSGDEYLVEFEDRLDRRIASTRESSGQQAAVRFKSLDTDKNERMSWDEYAASGKRMFDRLDTNGDRVVDARDPAPPPTPAVTAPAVTAPAASAAR